MLQAIQFMSHKTYLYELYIIYTPFSPVSFGHPIQASFGRRWKDLKYHRVMTLIISIIIIIITIAVVVQRWQHTISRCFSILNEHHAVGCGMATAAILSWLHRNNNHIWLLDRLLFFVSLSLSLPFSHLFVTSLASEKEKKREWETEKLIALNLMSQWTPLNATSVHWIERFIS